MLRNELTKTYPVVALANEAVCGDTLDLGVSIILFGSC